MEEIGTAVGEFSVDTGKILERKIVFLFGSVRM
jgi:hypothetical protein